jgi:hypothetical protein
LYEGPWKNQPTNHQRKWDLDRENPEAQMNGEKEPWETEDSSEM